MVQTDLYRWPKTNMFDTDYVAYLFSQFERGWLSALIFWTASYQDIFSSCLIYNIRSRTIYAVQFLSKSHLSIFWRSLCTEILCRLFTLASKCRVVILAGISWHTLTTCVLPAEFTCTPRVLPVLIGLPATRIRVDVTLPAYFHRRNFRYFRKLSLKWRWTISFFSL